MKSFEFERWDAGRLTVNREFAGLLRAHGLTTFDSLMNDSSGEVAKNVLSERTTSRFVLTDRHGRQAAFYIKRHTPPPWKEYVKPLLRLAWPIIGARNEWQAMQRFHQAGIPTMVPVALGEDGRRSFVVSQAIEGCIKLSHWVKNRGNGVAAGRLPGHLVATVAGIARTMHAAGMHHQDFYLTHLLLPEDSQRDVHVIDLGRVRASRRLARRWIVKDLAQLNYSAEKVSLTDRCRFLRAYLGRRPRAADRPLIRSVLRKTRSIRQHSHKNSL